jgi:hypothetical protein
MAENDSEDAGGGESACFAHLICPDCGIVMDGTAHVQDCKWVDNAPDPTVSKLRSTTEDPAETP